MTTRQGRIDRELAEHLARDTGLSPTDIGDVRAGDDRARHLAEDTGVPEEEVLEHPEGTEGVTQVLVPPD